jgi:transcriptional regulator with XRE-family HTH domain
MSFQAERKSVVKEILAKSLRERRKMLAFTQQELAAKANISIRMLQQIEGEQSWPSPEVISRIAKALNIDEATLLTGRGKDAVPSKLSQEDMIDKLTQLADALTRINFLEKQNQHLMNAIADIAKRKSSIPTEIIKILNEYGDDDFWKYIELRADGLKKSKAKKLAPKVKAR